MGKKKKPDYHLYVDGSSLAGTNRYGIGWVKTDNKNRRPSIHSLRLPFAKACSTTAEVYATACALESLRKKSTVVVLTDCSVVERAIAENKFYNKIQKASRNKPLREAWIALSHAVNRHTEVAVVHTNQNEAEFMLKAHQAAQEGATQPLKKDGKDMRFLQKHPKESTDIEISDHLLVRTAHSNHNIRPSHNVA